MLFIFKQMFTYFMYNFLLKVFSILYEGCGIYNETELCKFIITGL